MNFKVIILMMSAAAVLLSSGFLFADVKPCNNCALERLVSPAQNPILSEPIDYDFSIFEMIHSDLVPRALKGFSQPEMLGVENGASAGETEYSSSEVIASYEINGKVNEIKYADLEKMLLSLPQAQQNLESVKYMPQKEKYSHLVNIVKTNLLFEEGLALKDKTGSVQLQDENEYNRNNIFMNAVNELLTGITNEYYSSAPAADSKTPDFREIALNRAARQIDLRLETDNVMLLKNIDNIALYTGETSFVLCTFKDDKVTLADIKKNMSVYFNGGVSYASFADEDFIKFMLYEIIFEHAYVKFLIKSDVKHSFRPYNEYYVYTLAEGFLNDHIRKIDLTPRECEDYFNKNPGNFVIKENIEVNYYVFKEPQRAFFEEAVKKGYKPAELSAKIKSGSVECEIFENEKFYKGQLMNETQNYLFSLDAQSYSKIIKIKTSGESGSEKLLLFYVVSKSGEKQAAYKDIEKMVYRRALADKKARASIELFDGLFKKYKVKINLNK
jgi:hypothetical protein